MAPRCLCHILDVLICCSFATHTNIFTYRIIKQVIVLRYVSNFFCKLLLRDFF